MKKAIVLILTVFTMLSCSSDEDSLQSSNNNITINNEVFDVPIFTMETTRRGKWYIQLMSDLYFEGGEGFYSGFIFYPTNNVELIDGEHIFNFSNSGEENTFEEFSYFVANNSFTSNNFEEIEGEVTGGTITIQKNGNTYTINIDGVNEDGDIVTGEYHGELTVY